MEELARLIQESEDWLILRVLTYAKERGYTKYTSTLREAWRISIVGLSGSIAAAAELFDGPPELGPDDDFATDPIAAFGVEEARRHRERGVTLGMFLGLTKYYRQSYVDLVEESDATAENKALWRSFVERCFDRIELGFTLEWSAREESDRTIELQENNRSITNEKNKYLTAFESVKGPILLLDENDCLDNWNLTASATFTGLERSGATYYDYERSKTALPWLAEALEELNGSGKDAMEVELWLETLDGHRCFVAHLKRMLDVSHKYSGTVVVLHDITSRKSAEDEIFRINKELEAFAYSVAHDLRTPLRGVVGFAELVARDHSEQVDAEGHRKLQVIQESAREMGDLINGLLEFSRQGSCELQHTEIDMDELMREVIAVEREAAADREFDIEVGELPTAIGDRTAIREVFANLVGNAVKYTKKRSVAEISVRGRRRDGVAIFTVQDNGVGFDMKYAGQVFNVFQRLHDREEFEGTGIGLALVQRIVNRHGGQVWVESEEDQGAAFHVSLPATRLS